MLSLLTLGLLLVQLSAQDAPEQTQARDSLRPSGDPTYKRYIDPKTGKDSEKKFHYGFQYHKDLGDREPIGERQYGRHDDTESQTTPYRWGWQYTDVPKIDISKKPQKAPKFIDFERGPIQVEVPRKEEDKKIEEKTEDKEAEKITPEYIRRTLEEAARKGRKE